MPGAPGLVDAELQDIQRLVLRATGLCYLQYHLFGVIDPSRARRFVESLLAPGALCVTTGMPGDAAGSGADSLLYVAFTHAGLDALGVPRASLLSFPEVFREGAKA